MGTNNDPDAPDPGDGDGYGGVPGGLGAFWVMILGFILILNEQQGL